MKAQSKNEFAGNIWKFGCNWEGCENSFYDFIQEEQIVIGRENWRYSAGDLVAITEGFTVKAIVKVKEEPQSITDNDSYANLQQDYNIAYDDATIYAKAEWYELPENEVFVYAVQRGAARVRNENTKEHILNLWNNRNK